MKEILLSWKVVDLGEYNFYAGTDLGGSREQPTMGTSLCGVLAHMALLYIIK